MGARDPQREDQDRLTVAGAGTADLAAPAAGAGIGAALRRAQWQPILFGTPSRARLAECTADWPLASVRVEVLRNHAFEPVASAMAPYAAWNGLRYAPEIGPYDDALPVPAHTDADVTLVWLDLGRLTGLTPLTTGAWLGERLAALRARGTAPIVVAAWPLPPVARAALETLALPGVHVADVDALAATLAEGWVDARTQTLAGTRLSNRACLLLAQELACRWLPACTRPPCKGVIVDLDDTLYAGVLGEDGPAGVLLTPGHRALQAQLAALAERGVLVAIASRNDPSDVAALFAARSDFPLRPHHVTAIEAGYGAKVNAVARIASHWRIGEDAIAFVDDNPGEIAAVASASPMATVLADADGEVTRRALAGVAGLWQWRGTREDALRTRDLATAAARSRLASSLAPADYFRELGMTLHYRVGAADALSRAADLVRKTNQFNLSLGRESEAGLAARLAEDPRNVVTVALADRLSDSGVVAAVAGRVHGRMLHVDEVVVSCRALGRRLEAALLAHALRLMAQGRDIATFAFAVAEGPRNAPAREWLATLAGAPAHAGTVHVDAAAIAAVTLPDVIDVRCEQATAAAGDA